MGIDPETLFTAIRIGNLYAKAGVRGFKEWAKTAISRLGNIDIADLKKIYRAVRKRHPEYNLQTDEEIDKITENDIIDTENDNETDGQSNLDDGSGSPDRTESGEAGETSAVGGAGELSDEDSEADMDSRRPGNETRPQSDTGTSEGVRRPGHSDAGESQLPADRPERKPSDDAGRIQPKNHVIGKDDVIAPRGEITQLKANIAAIKLLKELEAADREATPEEKKILAQFTGWGNLSQAFDKNKAKYADRPGAYFYDENWAKKWHPYYKQLRDLMTEEEFNAAAESTLNAHYTDREVIGMMWQIAEQLGFSGGTVLEEGMGSGHFFGLMPQEIAGDSKMIGIELDSLTGRIAKKLYPEAKIFVKGLEDVALPHNTVDLVIGNFPFAKEAPADATSRYGLDLNLHNYFFARALDALKPGGLVIAISTHFTMDGSIQQRRLLTEKGQLVGAIRLPNNAFKASAGTEVTTDIVILRKPDHSSFKGQPWTSVSAYGKPEVEDTGKKDSKGRPITVEHYVTINEYFVNNPDMMLGNPTLHGTMRGGKYEFTLEPNGEQLIPQMKEAIGKLPGNIFGEQAADELNTEDIETSTAKKEGRIFVDESGKLKSVQGGKIVDAKKVFGRFDDKHAKAFIGVRDHYQNHIEMMLNPEATDEQIEASRVKLNEIYDSYVKKYGAVSAKKSSVFDADPGYYLLRGLEIEEILKIKGKREKVFTKSPVFKKRTIMPRTAPQSVETIEDGLQVSLAYHGNIDINYLSQLTGISVNDIEEYIIDKKLGYLNPETGFWESPDQYLSGQIRKKLNVAKIAAEQDGRYHSNIESLENAIPPTVAIKDIHFKLGGTWIPVDVVKKFVAEVFRAPKVVITYSKKGDFWSVEGKTLPKNTERTERWGTQRVSGDKVLEKTLNQKTIIVYDRWKDLNGSHAEINQKETLAAQLKQKQLSDAFVKWIAKNEDSALDLQKAYNDHFNNFVQRQYDGDHLTLPGANDDIRKILRNYQRNGIWRVIQDGFGMLAHVVGAGKTYTMAGVAMETRRLGLAKKPLMVVPNSTIEQFAGQFKAMYPAANLLVATKKDMNSRNRQVFLSRMAAGDYDAVIMPQSSFNLLPNDPQRELQYITDQIADLEDALYEAAMNEGKDGPSVKELQRRIKALRKKVHAIMDKVRKRQDNAELTFEQLGVDLLILDEAHMYKKPPFLTKQIRIKGLETGTSQTAFSAMMKVRHVQDKMNGKGVVLATGTPVTNTLGEAWHMMNILAPHLLKDFNVETFDKFTDAFAKVEPTMDMNAGQKWVYNNTLVQFANGNEFINFIRTGWDVISRDDMAQIMKEQGKKLPKIKGGSTEIVAVPESSAVHEFNNFLKQVYQKFDDLRGKDKKKFSWVPVVTYNAARSAALDIRLVYPKAKDDEGSKVNRLVNNVVSIYNEANESETICDNATQAIFCDSMNFVSMEKLNQFMAGEQVHFEIDEADEEAEYEDLFLYEDIKRKLIESGIPEEEILIGNILKPHQREDAFRLLNEGKYRVVIGSTKKIGTGLNYQERLYAIHHLDSPWLPADLEQREGRILRPGNLNEEVRVLSYGMKGTLDAAIYTKILRKSRNVWQALAGKVTSREFDDPSSPMVLSAREQQALLADDPRIFEKLELETKLRTALLEQETYQDSRARANESKREIKKDILDITERRMPHTETIAENLANMIDGENWNAEIGGVKYNTDDFKASEKDSKGKDKRRCSCPSQKGQRTQSRLFPTFNE